MTIYELFSLIFVFGIFLLILLIYLDKQGKKHALSNVCQLLSLLLCFGSFMLSLLTYLKQYCH